MILDIQSPNIKLTQEITGFLDKKIKMLSRRHNEILGIDVSFRIEKSCTNENKQCEIRLAVSGYDLMASAQCKSFEEAISQTSEALERQIEKHKSKLENAKYTLKK